MLVKAWKSKDNQDSTSCKSSEEIIAPINHAQSHTLSWSESLLSFSNLSSGSNKVVFPKRSWSCDPSTIPLYHVGCSHDIGFTVHKVGLVAETFDTFHHKGQPITWEKLYDWGLVRNNYILICRPSSHLSWIIKVGSILFSIQSSLQSNSISVCCYSHHVITIRMDWRMGTCNTRHHNGKIKSCPQPFVV